MPDQQETDIVNTVKEIIETKADKSWLNEPLVSRYFGEKFVWFHTVKAPRVKKATVRGGAEIDVIEFDVTDRISLSATREDLLETAFALASCALTETDSFDEHYLKLLSICAKGIGPLGAPQQLYTEGGIPYPIEDPHSYIETGFDWAEYAFRIDRALRLWEAKSRGTRDTLPTIEENSNLYQEEQVPHFAHFADRIGDPSEWGKTPAAQVGWNICGLASSALHAGSMGVRFTPTGPKFAAPNLRTAIWMAIVEEFFAGTLVGRCESASCGKWFAARGRQLSGVGFKQTCNNTCRQRLFAERKRQQKG